MAGYLLIIAVIVGLAFLAVWVYRLMSGWSVLNQNLVWRSGGQSRMRTQRQHGFLTPTASSDRRRTGRDNPRSKQPWSW